MNFGNFVGVHKWNGVILCFMIGFWSSAAGRAWPPPGPPWRPGISKSLVSKWKANEAKEPSPEVVRKLSEYFGVSPYEVLEDLPAGRGRSTLTERERRDVAPGGGAHHGGLGEQRGPDVRRGAHVPEARDSLTAAMKLGLEAARLRNKETYTPKKYRGPKEEA